MGETKIMGGVSADLPPSPAPLLTGDERPHTVEELEGLYGKHKTYPKIGECRVGGKLGAGGESLVFLGQQQLQESPAEYRRVAIRVCLGRSYQDQRRFVQGSLVMGRLRTPYFAQLFGAGITPGGHHYAVLEYMDGETLAQVLQERAQKNGRLSLLDIRKILHDVCAGAQALHQKGIVHRDLKPDNVMLNGEVPGHDPYLAKLLDPGTVLLWAHHTSDARSLLLDAASGRLQALGRELDELFGHVTRTRLTVTGQVMGTPGYMAPEACLTSSVDRRADVYAIGVMLLEMLNGSLPYQAGRGLVGVQKFMLARVQGEHYRDPKVAHPEFPAETAPKELLFALRAALEWDPDRRLRDPLDLYKRVAAHLGPRRAMVVSKPTPQRLQAARIPSRWRPLIFGAGVSVIAMLVLLAVLKATGLAQFGAPTYQPVLRKAVQIEQEPEPAPKKVVKRGAVPRPAPGVPKGPTRPAHRDSGRR